MTDEQPPILPGFGHHRDELPGGEDNKPELAKAIRQADSGRWILIAVVAVLALLVAILYPYFSHLSESKYNKAQDKAITAGQQAASGKALASALAKECKDPAVRADLGGICIQASSVATQTPPVAIPTRTLIIPGPQGIPATNGQIQAAVTVYLAAHPPPIDYSILKAFVTTYLVTHPAPSGASGASGQNGKTPVITTAALVDAVNSVCTQTPSPCAGPQGSPGESGQSGQSGASGLPGSSGPPGPNCPPGYEQATVTPHPVEEPGTTWVVCASTPPPNAPAT